MPPPAVVLIGNPAAGRGRGARRLAAAEVLARARGVACTVRPTRHPGEAEGFAREAAAAGATLVVALGGDGTVRDVAAGLVGVGEAGPALGIVPVGTGNDLARSLLLPFDVPGAVAVALGPDERLLDVWGWNGVPFVNVAGVGLDAAVARVVNTRFRRLRGPLPYVAGLLSVLPGFRPFALRVAGPEGEWTGQAWLAALGNGRYYGGGMCIAPGALTDDGLLEVVVVGDVSRGELLRQFPGLFAGRHVRHPRVGVLRLSECRVEAVAPGPTLDGELLDGLPARVTRLGRLRVRAAAG